MSEEIIVQYGAPTLAGIKTGNLFTCPFADRGQTMKEFRRLNRELGPKGLRVLPMRYSDKRVLVYLFRPERLEKDLSAAGAAELLERAGYRHENATQCVAELIRRLNSLGGEFPHEIGLFLSYPPEDVRGFIDNKGECSKCVGCWKVYGDEKKARDTFDRYKNCTAEYMKRYMEGVSLEKLAVAV